jgi:hypothetical protein
MMRLCLWILLSLLLVMPAAAQDDATAPFIATAFRDLTVRAGPGITHRPTSGLGAGVPVRIIERSVTGIWMRVVLENASGEPAWDGWVMRGYLTLSPNLRLSEVPVNREVSDDDPTSQQRESFRRLYGTPIITPHIDTMRAIFLRGQEMGNRADVITKVGDSVTADERYLQPMSQPGALLGPFDFLAPTLTYFGEGAGEASVAARIGMTSYVVLDPMWADPSQCEGGETPLACEYRRRQPSIAFIMFGANDVQHMTYEEYAVQIDEIVDLTLDAGIIPVLSTFSYSPDNALFPQSLEFNLRVLEIAEAQQVPLINLWAAARALPDYGLDIDGIHMLQSGFRYLKFDTGHDAFYGTSLRNLLSLIMLDELRVGLSMEGET